MKREVYSFEQFPDKMFTPAVEKCTVVSQALTPLTVKRQKTVIVTLIMSCGQLNQHLITRHTVYFVEPKTCIVEKKSDFILVPVRTYDFQNKVLEACRNRQVDWSLKVQARVEFVSDLLF